MSILLTISTYLCILGDLVRMFILVEQGSAAKGSLSKEDAAFLCVEALDAVPQKELVFEV